MSGEANTNCLAGMKCPQCGSLGPFNIETTAIVAWTDDGTTGLVQPDFSDDAYCDCHECDYAGIVDEWRRT